MMTAPRAVLWDMDGTLIDSEEFHWLAWRDTMTQEGHPITREQFLASFGQRNDTIVPQLLGSAATHDRVDRISNAKEQMYRDRVRQKGISPLPGVTTWLQRLREQGWLQAIASAAPRANLDVILAALGAGQYFQGLVSAEDVHRGKPDPEVFLTAAAKLHAPPHSCIVVEDAAAGIEGARRAGMRSIGVSRNGKPLSADIVVQSLDLLDPHAFDSLLKPVAKGHPNART